MAHGGLRPPLKTVKGDRMKKNVQIPLQVFLKISLFLAMVDIDQLCSEEKALHEELLIFFAKKSARLRNEVAYTEYLRAGKHDKDTALENYLATRKLGF